MHTALAEQVADERLSSLFAGMADHMVNTGARAGCEPSTQARKTCACEA